MTSRFLLVLGLVLAGYGAARLVLEWRPADATLSAALDSVAPDGDRRLANRARRQMGPEEPESARLALVLLRHALRLNPHSPYRWCDLAEAHARLGATDQAAQSFERAVALGPQMPPVLLRAAGFYLGAGHERRALELMARILELVPDYDDILFSYYVRMELDFADVLRHGLPDSPRAARSLRRYLLNTGAASRADQTRDWMLARSPTGDLTPGDRAQALLPSAQR